MAESPPRRSRLAARLLAAALTAVFLAGCADVPTSGLLTQSALPAGPGGGAQQAWRCCGVIMYPPHPGWNPAQIVQGFILASANFDDQHAIAREYLAPGAGAKWQPGPGPAVTVIAQLPTVTYYARPFGSPGTAIVQISALELGKVTASGQYIPAVGGGSRLTQEFSLQLVHRQWRITVLPGSSAAGVSHELLLANDMFQLDYQPRNLYYFDPSEKILVPDPVFVPIDAADPGTELVQALIASPQGWLAGAAFSAFPPAARIRRPVQVPPGSNTAIVDLSLPKSATTLTNLQDMSAQLVWTLTSSSYGAPAIEAVKLEVNGRPWGPPGRSVVQDRDSYPQPALEPPGHEDLYYLSGGAARVMHGRGPGSDPVAGPAGTGRVPLSSIAVSPDEHYLAGLAQSAGSAVSTVYTSDLAAAGKSHAAASAGALTARLTGTSFTAASWDHADNLWVAGTVGGKPGVWMIAPGGAAPIAVTLPAGLGPVTALKVAPDGVRVAMIIGTGPGAQVLIAAVVRDDSAVMLSSAGQIAADLSDPSGLTWYDADHLLVVNQSASGPQLEEVPVNGDASTYEEIEPGMTTITAAGPHNLLFAGLQTGSLVKSLGLGELWSPLASGRVATYPG